LLDEGAALLHLAPKGEDLLKLVDDDHRRTTRRTQALERVLARREDRQVQGRARAVAERRDKAGANDRGLAASGRAHNSEQAGLPELGREMIDELLATEEELAVLRLEDEKPFVRTRDVGRGEGVIGQPG